MAIMSRSYLLRCAVALFLSALLPSCHSFSCPGPSGNYANPEDCASFYQCVDYEEHLVECAEGTMYDDALVSRK